jgi:hypothetical protein
MFNQGVSDSYTAIRLAKNIVSEPVMTTSTSLTRLSGGFSRIINCLADYLKGQGSLVSEVAALRQNFKAAYNEGYAYHQEQVKESPELLAWVLRPDYLDGQIPSVEIEE